MSQQNSEKKVIAESEISDSGVGHSKMHEVPGEAVEVSSDDLKLALEESNKVLNKMSKELDALRQENANLKAQGKPQTYSDDSLNKLANMLADAIKAPKEPQAGPVETDNINRTDSFKERTNIDGAGLMEAQATMMLYKSENKVPISIPKTFQSQFGPFLSISVNGVRVAIPCDGKTYMINETHAMHARERIAKVDRLLSNTEPEITEVNA